MRESTDLDEMDLLLVTALQISPRASWQQIGHVLGVSPSTAARRWDRLTESGLAWLSCHPMRLPGVAAVLALIEVTCVSARLPEVATEIVEDSHVFNVSHVTGPADLVITAAFTDQISLGRYLRFRIGALDGVQSTRAQIVTALHTDGSHWRLDRLGAEHHRVLLADRPTTVVRGGPEPADLELMTALGVNPRQSAADLARITGQSMTSVRRRLGRIEAGRFVAIRCEMARTASGWSTAVIFRAAIPPDHADRITSELVKLRETRFCASLLSGPDNLTFAVWLRSATDLQPFEVMLTRRIPELTVVTRHVALWQMKLGGHVVDPNGRHVRGIPMALWSEENAVASENLLVNRLRTESAESSRDAGSDDVVGHGVSSASRRNRR